MKYEYEGYAVREIRPDKEPVIFFVSNSEEDAKRECARCRSKGDFNYDVVVVIQKLEGRLLVTDADLRALRFS